MDADQLLKLLGRRADDPALEAVFVNLRTLRRPALSPDDPEAFVDWVLIRRQGVELGFADEVYFEADLKRKRRRKGVPLIFWQAYFYTHRSDVADFTGALPFGLVWSDNRDEARRKLSSLESTRRSYLNDCWDVSGYCMTLSYKKGNKAIESIVCQLPFKPWPEQGRIQPALGVVDWISLFGLARLSPELRKRLQPLDLKQRMDESDDEKEVDFRFECGLELEFTESKYLKRVKKPVGVKRSDLLFSAARFFRSRDLDARQWTGELPFKLSFDDTQQVMLAKMGRKPDEQEDDQMGGYALWHFPEYSVHVMYENMKNYLMRITLMAPGYWPSEK